MFSVTTVNCEGKTVVLEYENKEAFISSIDSNSIDVPMLDDRVIAVISDGVADYNEVETVEDLYNSIELY